MNWCKLTLFGQYESKYRIWYLVAVLQVLLFSIIKSETVRTRQQHPSQLLHCCKKYFYKLLKCSKMIMLLYVYIYTLPFLHFKVASLGLMEKSCTWWRSQTCPQNSSTDLWLSSVWIGVADISMSFHLAFSTMSGLNFIEGVRDALWTRRAKVANA